MRVYETMVIFDPSLDDQDVRDQVARIGKVVEERGGKLRNVDYWGRRDLAYEIRHKREGHYVVIVADAEPVAMDEVSRQLHLADVVFRHKTMRLPEKVAQPLGDG